MNYPIQDYDRWGKTRNTVEELLNEFRYGNTRIENLEASVRALADILDDTNARLKKLEGSFGNGGGADAYANPFGQPDKWYSQQYQHKGKQYE